MPKWVNDLTFEEVDDLFKYDPDTGFLFRKKEWGPWKSGDKAGTLNKINGYVIISIGTETRRSYRAHRLAWLLYYGKWPENEIDHINRLRADNRIINLRQATPSQNMANKPGRRDGLKGAYPMKNGRWRAVIGRQERAKHLGVFDTEHEAHQAYLAAAKNRYGEFARAD
jgi:hypothetical protein